MSSGRGSGQRVVSDFIDYLCIVERSVCISTLACSALPELRRAGQRVCLLQRLTICLTGSCSYQGFGADAHRCGEGEVAPGT
jgi:hypothetical protein